MLVLCKMSICFFFNSKSFVNFRNACFMPVPLLVTYTYYTMLSYPTHIRTILWDLPIGLLCSQRLYDLKYGQGIVNPF